MQEFLSDSLVAVSKDDPLFEFSYRQRLHTSHTIFVGSIAGFCLYIVDNKFVGVNTGLWAFFLPFMLSKTKVIFVEMGLKSFH